MAGTRQKYPFALLACALWILLTPAVHARDTQIRELEQMLKERDQVINELLERVSALERRVGVQRTVPASAESHQSETETMAKRAGNHGDGPAPGRVMVKEEDAERALERSLTREGAILLPPGTLEIEPGFHYARHEDATPTLVTMNGGVFSGELERNTDNLSADLAMRLGLPWDAQLEIGVPYLRRDVETVTSAGFSSIGSSNQSGSGFGDVRLGLAKTLLHEGIWLPDLVGRFTWNSDSGNTSDNGILLGGGFHEFQASLTAIKRQDPLVFFGGLSYQHTLAKNGVRPGPAVSANFGGFLALSPRTSLRLLFSTTLQDETRFSGKKIDGSNRFTGNFIIGGSSLLTPGILLNLSAGIGLTRDTDDFSVMLSLPIRFDKPLF